jgi:hypothetical protein
VEGIALRCGGAYLGLGISAEEGEQLSAGNGALEVSLIRNERDSRLVRQCYSYIKKISSICINLTRLRGKLYLFATVSTL